MTAFITVEHLSSHFPSYLSTIITNLVLHLFTQSAGNLIQMQTAWKSPSPQLLVATSEHVTESQHQLCA